MPSSTQPGSQKYFLPSSLVPQWGCRVWGQYRCSGLVEFQAVVVEAVPVVRGMPPLVGLASPNMEALRLLGGADGCDGESLIILPQGGCPRLVRSRRPGRQTNWVNAHVQQSPGPRDGVRGAWASQREPVALLQRPACPDRRRTLRTVLCRTEIAAVAGTRQRLTEDDLENHLPRPQRARCPLPKTPEAAPEEQESARPRRRRKLRCQTQEGQPDHGLPPLRRKVYRAGAGAAGRGPPRIDDYAAHFHHHPWQGASLKLTPRLRKRLGDGVGGTDDDGDEHSEADAERAVAANDYVGSVSEAPRCVVLMDARGCVEEALKSDVGAARRVILNATAAATTRSLGRRRWTRTGRRTSSGVPSGGVVLRWRFARALWL